MIRYTSQAALLATYFVLTRCDGGAAVLPSVRAGGAPVLTHRRPPA